LSSPVILHRRASRPASFWRLWLTWALACLLVASAMPVRADGVELSAMSTARSDDGLELSFSTRFELPRAAEDALMKGVSLYFVAEVSVQRKRWYWRDARASKAARSWRLYWYALTRQYRVSSGGLTQSFNNLPEALASLRGVSGWRIAEARELDEDGSHYLEFSYRLDTSQLPKPMQIGLSIGQGWNLGVERNLGLNPDFSLRTAAASAPTP
jgi:hypothetical protein